MKSYVPRLKAKEEPSDHKRRLFDYVSQNGTSIGVHAFRYRRPESWQETVYVIASITISSHEVDVSKYNIDDFVFCVRCYTPSMEMPVQPLAAFFCASKAKNQTHVLGFIGTRYIATNSSSGMLFHEDYTASFAMELHQSEDHARVLLKQDTLVRLQHAYGFHFYPHIL